MSFNVSKNHLTNAAHVAEKNLLRRSTSPETSTPAVHRRKLAISSSPDLRFLPWNSSGVFPRANRAVSSCLGRGGDGRDVPQPNRGWRARAVPLRLVEEQRVFKVHYGQNETENEMKALLWDWTFENVRESNLLSAGISYNGCFLPRVTSPSGVSV